MRARRSWRRIFRLDVGRDHVERDVDEEIAFHLAMRAEKLRREGADAEAAAGQARTQFGDLPAIRGQLVTIDHSTERAVKRGLRIDHLAHDLRYAFRALRLHRGFSIVVVFTLALGIGANTAIYSLVNALLLRPLPVAHPEQLVALGDVTQTNSSWTGSPRTDVYSYPLYKDVRDNNTVFSGLYGTAGAGSSLQFVIGNPTAADSSKLGLAPKPEYPRARYVTANYFRVLGVGAEKGRVFTPDEDRVPGEGAVLVISDGYWRRRFDRDPAVIGRTVSVNHVPMTIVGITPPSFTGDIVDERTDAWIPISMEPALVPTNNWLNDRLSSGLLLMGRRKPGVTLAQARAALTPLIQRLLDQGVREDPGDHRAQTSQSDHPEITLGARGFSYWRPRYATSLYTLLVAVALVLLIVCANVTNLLLGRATSRQREIGVRLAVGAGRGRLVQQLMIESLTLAITGAALGLLLAHWGIALLLRFAAGGGNVLPIDTRLDGSVLAFTAGVTVATALLFGLAPALRATQVDLATVLRAHARGISGRWHRFGAGRVLVILQVALSLTMLVATGMVVRSLRALETRDVGLDRDHLLIVPVNAEKLQRSDSALEGMRQALAAKIGALPGVTAVSFSRNGLFSGSDAFTSMEIPGFVPRVWSDSVIWYDVVGPDYFSAIGAQMVRGRGLTTDDMGNPGPVAVINEAFARRYFPGQDPIGKTLGRGGPPYRIVGVVGNIHASDLRGTPPPRLYFPMWERAGNGFTFEVRTAGDPALLVEPVRSVLVATEPALRVGGISPLTALMNRSISQDILMARLVSGFGVLALGLAAMGLYGILSYATLRRTGEFGLRMALGAQPGTILRMVLREGLALIGYGLLAGVPLLVIGASLLRSQLYGVRAADPVSIAFAVAILAGSAIAAGLVPALRAARVEPLVALQTE